VGTSLPSAFSARKVRNSLPKLLTLLLIAFAANHFAREASASILGSGDAMARWSGAGSGDRAAHDSADGMSEMGSSSGGDPAPIEEVEADPLGVIAGSDSSSSTTSTPSTLSSPLSQCGVVSPFVGIEASPRTHAVWREAGRFVPDAPGSELIDPPRKRVDC
jgi:hypothetical protein